MDFGWRCLKTFIALMVYLILTFTNFYVSDLQIDLKDNFVNNLKNSNARRFLRFKMI